MDTSRNEFMELNHEQLKKAFEVEGNESDVKVLVENGKLIEFPIGQEFALNGYWFKVVGVQNKNPLILEGMGMTAGFAKRHNIK